MTAQMTREEFVRQLQGVYGTALECVVLYGSAAGDDAVPGHSDQNLLVVVSGIDVASLRALGQTTRAWQEAGNPPPLTLTRHEWRSSSDIFPMEYTDILQRHRVLVGALPLDGLHISREHLRLQIEQEAMGKLLRLRRGVMAAGTGHESQQELMRASFSSLVVIFRAVLRLHDDPAPRSALDAVRQVAAIAGFDPVPFERVAALVRGTKLAPADTESTLTGYLRGMTELVAHLDRFDPPASASPELAP